MLLKMYFLIEINNFTTYFIWLRRYGFDSVKCHIGLERF